MNKLVLLPNILNRNEQSFMFLVFVCLFFVELTIQASYLQVITLYQLQTKGDKLQHNLPSLRQRFYIGQEIGLC